MLEKLKYLTAGESHGKGLLGIIDGIPANLEISEDYIKSQLSRRQKGHGRSNRMKIESDFAQLYCGVRQGCTNGGPIGLIIENKDYKNWSECMSIEKNNYSKKVTLPRPGHADLAGVMKFGFDDIRDVIERSSARETAMRVALSSVCRKMLEDLDIELCSRVVQIHNIEDKSPMNFSKSLTQTNLLIDKSDVRCLDKNTAKKMINAIDEAKKNGDSDGLQLRRLRLASADGQSVIYPAGQTGRVGRRRADGGAQRPGVWRRRVDLLHRWPKRLFLDR